MPGGIPAPRRWHAGGRERLVSRLTPLAIAEGQQLLRDRIPHPHAEVLRILAALSPEVADELRARLATMEAAWPPDPGSPEAREVALSPEGRALTIYHALRKSDPGLTRAEASELAESATDAEFSKLLELCDPHAPDDEEYAIFSRPDGPTVPYEEARAWVCETYGLGPEACDDMDPVRFASLCRRGKPACGASRETLDAIREALREQAEDGPEAEDADDSARAAELAAMMGVGNVRDPGHQGGDHDGD